MESSVSPKDEIWFLRVCHHISNAVYNNEPATFTIYRLQTTDFVKSLFDVLLTVYLSIFILEINQIDAQNVCFAISLFYASTCFEHHVLIIRRSKLYYTASGIVTPVGGRPVRSPLSTCAPDGHLQVL